MVVLTAEAYDGPRRGGEGKGGRPSTTSVVLILRELQRDHTRESEDRDIQGHDPTYDCGLREAHRDHAHDHENRNIHKHDSTYDCGL
eukprot:4154803-Pyramimonas_sp.AAC.1